MKVSFITYSRAPYRTDQLEEICKVNNLDLTVYYVGRTIKSRNWNIKESSIFQEVHLEGFSKLGNHFIFYPNVKKIVQNSDLILIGGYNSTASYLFTFYAKRLKKKLVFVMDGISPQKIKESRSIKLIPKRWIIKKMDAFFANGEVSRDYLRLNYQINDQYIFNQFLTVDVKKINEIRKGSLSKITKIKNDKYNNRFTILYAGRLLKRKQVINILKAVSKVKNNQDIQIVIIGSGEESRSLKEYARNSYLNVDFIDFISDQKVLFEYYNIADCFILPSVDEPWGLVVNEAESAHLPVIATEACGCVNDLVKDGYNGYVIRENNIDDLADKIYLISKNREHAKVMGNNSFELISNWTHSNSALSFKKLLEEIF